MTAPLALCFNGRRKKHLFVLCTSTRFKERKELMTARNAYSALLAALIALPMYYMFYSIFNKGLDTNVFIVAFMLGVATFLITLVIAYLVRRSKQQA